MNPTAYEGFGDPEHIEGFGPPESKTPPTNPIISALAQAGNAATMGAGPRISAAADVLGELVKGKLGLSGVPNRYSQYKTAQENYLAQGQHEHPIQSIVAQGLGGATSALALPGGAAAEEGAGFLGKIVDAMRPSAAYGAVSGYLGSKAKDWKGKLADELRGFSEGGLIGGSVGAAHGVASAAADTASPFLEKLGLSQLTKATVGSSSRAFKLLREKGLSEDSARYLADMGIGAGDSTESITEKLVNRGKEIRGKMDDTIGKLNTSGGTVDPDMVAKRIEEGAAPLNHDATSEDYEALMRRADSIRKRFAGRKLSFSEAVAERKAADKKANWNVQKDVGASEGMKTTARAWNDEIDSAAESLLHQQGEAGDAFRSQRHEYATVAELREGALKNLDRQQGRDEGLVSGAASYIPRTYGKAATGRAALNAAEFLNKDHDQFVDFLRGAALSPLSRQQDQGK